MATTTTMTTAAIAMMASVDNAEPCCAGAVGVDVGVADAVEVEVGVDVGVADAVEVGVGVDVSLTAAVGVAV
jgi:hypothetical protein